MKRVLLALFFVAIFSINAISCVKITTTTFILSSIVKQIGKEFVDVSYLIPNGSNPHIFSPKPKSLVKLSKSDMFVGVGYGFEFWLDRIKYMLKDKDVLMMSDLYKTPLDKAVVNGKVVANPHIWLDMDFVGNEFVFALSDRLCRLDSLHCSYFKKNAKEFSRNVEDIKNSYINEFDKLKGYCFLDIKPALEYLLKSAQVKSCYVLIKKGNKEPKIRDMIEAVKHCQCKKGFVLYINNLQLAKTMSNKLNFTAVEMNPLGDVKNINSYQKLLIYNLHQIKQAVK